MVLRYWNWFFFWIVEWRIIFMFLIVCCIVVLFGIDDLFDVNVSVFFGIWIIVLLLVILIIMFFLVSLFWIL